MSPRARWNCAFVLAFVFALGAVVPALVGGIEDQDRTGPRPQGAVLVDPDDAVAAAPGDVDQDRKNMGAPAARQVRR